MGKYKYLANNIALFSISNFVSKILVFLLVPFYTNVLTTAEYGIADIFQVTLLLLVPALTLNVGEAALRFGIEYENRRGSILYVGLTMVGKAAVFVAVAAGIGALFVEKQMKWYLFLFVILFAANALYEFLVLYFQGCEKVQIVVCGSVFSTLIIIACNIFFLLLIRIGLNGYLFSQMIAYALAALFMLMLDKKQTFDKFEADPELKKEMLSYGKPMILYSTGSWINNASDRYLVAGLLGAGVNGLYGVAYKIPAILMVFQRIFAQAWQMSATKSYSDEQSGEFFNSMYKGYRMFMVLGCSGLILFVRLIAQFMFQKEFFEAWRFVPPLLISVIFGALTGFLGSICLAHKDAKSMGIATLIGAVLNIVLNIVLIPRIGAMGAAIATAISYFCMYAFAMYFVSKYVKLQVNYWFDGLVCSLLILQSCVMILKVKYGYFIAGGVFLLLILLYLKQIVVFLRGLLGGFYGKKSNE